MDYCSKYTNYFGVVILVFGIFISCTNPKISDQNCPSGMIPCSDDSSDCCAVICEPGYHLCGNNLTDCCLDTTSHDLTWNFNEFGVYPSELWDVDVLSDGKIIAVGEITKVDSDSSWNGTGYEEYSAIIGDNGGWTLKKYTIGKWHVLKPKGVFAFTQNNVWLANGSLYRFYEDSVHTIWQRDINSPEVAEQVWGTSDDNIYAVGSHGLIVHFNGIVSTTIESGLNIHFRCISGSSDGANVFVVGYDDSGESCVLEIVSGNSAVLYQGQTPFSEPYGTVCATSTNEDIVYFVSSAGLWEYNYIDKTSLFISAYENKTINLVPRHIFVRNPDDIFIGCLNGEICHFNGVSWAIDNSISNRFNSVWLKGFNGQNDQIVSVGYCNFGVESFIGYGFRIK